MQSDDEDEGEDGDACVHVQARQDAKALLESLEGQQVRLRDGVTWTVVNNVLDSTEQSRHAELGPDAGLRGGLPVRDGDVHLLALWLKLYPGSIEDDLQRLNSQGILRKSTFSPVSQQEWVTFWGLVIGARQFSVQGRGLWETASDGFQPAPNFGQYMSWGRFQLIRELVKWSKADLDAQPTDPWYMFRRMTTDFNANRAANVHMQLVQVLDEMMSSWQPRKDKLGGLPNISYIQRKPKPLGTELKCVAEAATGMMVHLELQEGKDAMRKARFSPEQGVTAACTIRLCAAVGGSSAPHTYVADSWFGSVKVSMQCMKCLCSAVNVCGACARVHMHHSCDVLAGAVRCVYVWQCSRLRCITAGMQ
jgi:hypothetical protein